RAYPSGRSWGLGTPGAAVLIAAVNRHACLAVPRASPRSRENPHPYRNRDGGPVSLRSDERAMLRDSLRRLLTGTDPEKVALALDEFGWPDLLGADPAEAVPSLFEIQGETVSASPALNAVLAGPLLSSSGAAAEGEIGPVKPGAGDWTVALPGPGPGGRRRRVRRDRRGAARTLPPRYRPGGARRPHRRRRARRLCVPDAPRGGGRPLARPRRPGSHRREPGGDRGPGTGGGCRLGGGCHRWPAGPGP